MTFTEFLDRPKILDGLIRNDLQLLKSMREQSAVYSAPFHDASKDLNYPGRPAERHLEELDSVERCIRIRIDQLEAARTEQKNFFSFLPEREALLMTFRYSLCRSWEDIQKSLDLSRSHVYRLHARALEACEKRWEHGVPEEAPQTRKDRSRC